MISTIIPEINRIPFVTLGSEDSRDIDNLYLFSSMPSLQECKEFCDKKKDNRNIAVVENGVVRECYKGTPDELNNSLFYTYSLHKQDFENPISRPVNRIVPLKVFRALRVVLSHLTETFLREKIKFALRSRDFEQRRKSLEEVDFIELDLSRDYLKTIAFQLSQANALISGKELYTKTELRQRFPELEQLLSRGNNPELEALNKHRDLLLESMEKVYSRRYGSLNLFCFKNGPEVDFRSTKNWNRFVSQCRGIIIDTDTEQCIHYPFDKFFRVNEVHENNESLLPRVSGTEIVEKIDGSMVSIIKYKGRLILAFKGSFNANNHQLIKEIALKYPVSKLDFDRFSYVFEVVYPESRYPNGYNIIDYGNKRELFLIGLRDKLTNELLTYGEVEQVAKSYGFSVPRKYTGSLDDVLEETKLDKELEKEGYVARFQNGKMVKIKYKRYMKVIKSVNDLKTDLFVNKLLKADKKDAEEFIESLPINVREAGIGSKQRFLETYDRIKHYFESLVAAKGPLTEEYAIDHVPISLRKHLLRFYRGQRYEKGLETLAMQYFSTTKQFNPEEMEIEVNYAAKYIREKPEKRSKLLESIPDEDKEKAEIEINRFQEIYDSMEDYIKRTVEEYQREFTDFVLKSVPGALRKPLLRHSRRLSYQKKLEKVALSYYLNDRRIILE